MLLSTDKMNHSLQKNNNLNFPEHAVRITGIDLFHGEENEHLLCNVC